MYYELTKALLGEPEQRESVRAYEQALSQYFFDGATISLIPKYGEDTINIKIGDDKQFSVTQLGDGLQQVLILTYEAFLKKDQRCAFFIEEPELHMHAGMLRQLMNFYLNETDHFYFFTTHSNHLVDMVDESSDVMIQKFQKKPKDAEHPNGYFQIDQCDRDRDLLAQLGVRPSSVYLSNCTIWVEGITDRLYTHRYMQRYLQDIEKTDPARYAIYQRFMPNYHYSFVEYQGAGIVHWNFDEEQETVTTNDQGLDAHAACAAPLLVADGDVDKADRVSVLTKALGGKFQKLPCKEIENTLPKFIILKAAETTFSSRLKDKAFDVEALDQSVEIDYFDLPDKGIGYLLDQLLDMPTTEPKPTLCFATSSGTIDKKVDFCRNAITAMDKFDHKEWDLTDSAKALCERIFEHIAAQNPT
ncbi:MAG: AAA family ATPase [Pseudomonadota bacterium]|nr:AAA family ATPase [Pseudomonadota bacterium]